MLLFLTSSLWLLGPIHGFLFVHCHCHCRLVWLYVTFIYLLIYLFIDWYILTYTISFCVALATLFLPMVCTLFIAFPSITISLYSALLCNSYSVTLSVSFMLNPYFHSHPFAGCHHLFFYFPLFCFDCRSSWATVLLSTAILSCYYAWILCMYLSPYYIYIYIYIYIFKSYAILNDLYVIE